MSEIEGAKTMSITTIGILVAVGLLLIANQLRARPFGARMLALPLGFGGYLAYQYVYGAPTIANDTTLYAVAGLAGAAVGLLGGALDAVSRDDSTGQVMVRAGIAYAAILVALIGGRLAFAWAADNAWHAQVVQFCIDHEITGQAPIVAALMLMLVATIAARTLVLLVRVAQLGGLSSIAAPASVRL
jgi:hypothetical protein